MKLLLCGADGFIARQFSNLSKHDLVKTSRKEGSELFLDFMQPHLAALPEDVDAAVIMAARARLEDCENNPEESYQINVLSPFLLSKYFSSLGIFTLFLSSNQVFDGTVPHCHWTKPTCPRGEYGRQKAEAEAKLLSLDRVAILRLSKVLAFDTALLEDWRLAERESRAIYPFTDLYLAPVFVETVVKAIDAVIEEKRSGIYQLTGLEDVSYEAFARKLFPSAKIEARESGLKRALRPRYTSLALNISQLSKDELELAYVVSHLTKG